MICRILPAVVCVWLSVPADSQPASAAMPAEVSRVFDTYCMACHDDATRAGSFSLQSLEQRFGQRDLLRRWVQVHDRVAEGKMPPADASQPTTAERRQVVQWLNTVLTKASLVEQQASGRVPLRRLNRVEYENTLRDLFGIHVNVQELLPDDGAAAGYDTVSEALTISPVHLVRYQEAAERAIATAVPWRPRGRVEQRVTGREHTLRKHYEAVLERSARLDGDAVVYVAEDTRHLSIRSATTRRPGRYRIRASVRAVGTAGQPLPVFVGFVHRRPIQWDRLEDVVGIYDAPPGTSRVLDFEADLGEQENLFVTGWTLPYYTSAVHKQKLQEHTVAEIAGPALAVDWIEITGPLDTWPPLGYRRLFGNLPMTCDRIASGRLKEEQAVLQHDNEWKADPWYPVTDSPKADADRLIRDFLPLAFRRPVPAAEADRFVKFAQARLDGGYTFPEAMKAAYRLVLCSPKFLCRYEEPGRLDDYALASRLSYFLWSSMPDDELFKLAGQNRLHEPEVLRAQVERMLGDPKAARFTDNFTGQWLDLRKMMMTKPDRMYPEFDKYLLWSMPRETTAFFDEVLRNNRSLLEFVDSDWTMLNERLAQHYGIEGVHGMELRKVPLPADSRRGGVMTHASVLKVTANGTTTSPITRGAWVLERILGQPPSPPPPNLPAIEPDTRGATTIRQQLELHRNAPACATCHREIDPPGFALESFDVIGGWRERYRSGNGGGDNDYLELVRYPGKKVWLGREVETGYITPDGQAFESVNDYRKILLQNPDQIARNLVEQVLTYSTGSAVEFADRAVVDEIVARLRTKNYGFRTLIHEVVRSRPFLHK